MKLPDSVSTCIRRLEEAGFEAYAVGGCVRDSLLGLVPNDYDMCTSAEPQQICRVFSDCSLVHNGEKHGTIGVVMDGVLYEITTFRKEGGYRDSRHPDWVQFVPTVQEDLGRRDFTVNAMAYSPVRGLIDPWGGRQDLEHGILRAVGDPEVRFQEDALRILRGVRFSVRFHLTPDPATEQAMTDCGSLMANLAGERIFDELCKLLPLVTALDLLRFAPVLTQALPELAPAVGFEQHTPYHRYDVFTHIAYVTDHVPPSLPLRWAALLHDSGKPATFRQDSEGRGHFKGHAAEGARIVNQVLARLKAPVKLRDEVEFLISHPMIGWELTKRELRRRMGKYGIQAVRDLIALQIADYCSKGTGARLEDSCYPALQELLEEVLQEDACFTLKDLKISGRDLMDAGFAPGPGMGRCLSWLLQQVQDDCIPNSREALLAAAKEEKNDF